MPWSAEHAREYKADDETLGVIYEVGTVLATNGEMSLSPALCLLSRS
jgi:hypothetical protein